MQSPRMTEVRLSLGINVSILVILMIFAVLLSLPLRLLFNTNYYSASENELASSQASQQEARGDANATTAALLLPRSDFRKAKRCPRFPYEDRMKSIFVSDYDRNCTYVRLVVKMKKTERSQVSEAKPEAGAKQEKRKKSLEKETPERKESREEGADTEITKIAESEAEAAINATKDLRDGVEGEKHEAAVEGGEDKEEPVSVSSHILVAMLVVSGLFAFVEVLRIRLSKDKVLPTPKS